MTAHEPDRDDSPVAGDAPKAASRREFLQKLGLGAAGVAVGGSAGAAASAFALSQRSPAAALPHRSSPGFDHVVVVMFENRSFDNLLGWLYTADEKTKDQFDGLAQGSYSNADFDGNVIPAQVYTGSTDTIMQSPQPDPGEFFPHVNTQLFGTIEPASNAHFGSSGGMRPPFNRPQAGAVPDNSGFVKDFIVNFRNAKKREPTADEYHVAMGSFAPKMLPVLSTLAREFGVYDRWFAGVPSQTFCNRHFFHASTSHGYVTNHGGDDYQKWINGPAAPTIFNRLEDAGIPWRIYYDASQLVSFTGMLHAPVLEQYWKTNFRTMEQFYDDAEHGNLPAYSFIEPRMIFNHNDMHPPWGGLRESDVPLEDGRTLEVYSSALSDVRAGDELLQDLYDAVRTSATPKKSNAMNTALVITCDEHGGTYDHVAPPAAVPPHGAKGGEMGFAFDRLGCRVPTIVVSAYTAPGTVIHDEMHHGSIINTLCRQHELAPLTNRDASANPIFNAINLEEPRDPATWPTPHSMFRSDNPEDSPLKAAKKHSHRPLTAPAEGLTGLLLARFNPGDTAPTTYGEAYDAVNNYGKGQFGTRD